MAARYLLVEVDDAAVAKKLVERLNGQYAAGQLHEGRAYRVRAVWAKPTLFCQCTSADHGDKPYARGLKTGWWVHAACGRPNIHWAKGNHWFSALGRNILPGNNDYIPKGWGLARDAVNEAVITPTGDTPPTGDGKAAKRAARRAMRSRH